MVGRQCSDRIRAARALFRFLEFGFEQLLIAPADLAGRLGLSGGDRLPVTLIDLRPAEDYAAGHLPGAVHLASSA